MTSRFWTALFYVCVVAFACGPRTSHPDTATSSIPETARTMDVATAPVADGTSTDTAAADTRVDVFADAGSATAPDDVAGDVGIDQGAPVPDGVAEARTAVRHRLRLGAWNIKKLGHGDTKRYDLVADVIRDHFDVIGIIEVMQKAGGHPGYEQLVSELGDGWQGFVTDAPRPDTSSGNAEFYAIVWRTAVARPCAGWNGLRHVSDNDGGPNGSGENDFEREPAYGCFAAGPDAETIGFDFVLAVYHATWEEGATPAIQAEVGHLTRVFDEMAAAIPGERDLLLVGDFNLVPSDLATAQPFADRTEGSGSTLNSRGGRTGNLYDHLIVHDPQASAEILGDAEVLDVVGVASTPAAFYSTVSDHLPIVVEVEVGGSDDDP
jgi:hypothetical protein